jgi:hypothetical protein
VGEESFRLGEIKKTIRYRNCEPVAQPGKGQSHETDERMRRTTF